MSLLKQTAQAKKFMEETPILEALEACAKDINQAMGACTRTTLNLGEWPLVIATTKGRVTAQVHLVMTIDEDDFIEKTWQPPTNHHKKNKTDEM